MNISEDTFASWARGPGQTEADQCENAVRAVPKAIDEDEDLAALDISVYPQGSFRVRTNVPGDSDVDVCIRYNGAFFGDYPAGKTQEHFGIVSARLAFADFKTMVEVALGTILDGRAYEEGTRPLTFMQTPIELTPMSFQHSSTGATRVGQMSKKLITINTYPEWRFLLTQIS